MTELLVVLAIISLLTTLAVPIYRSKVEDARYRTAQTEARNIAEAQEHVALTHGFYVPFCMLDDVAEVQGRNATLSYDDLWNTAREVTPCYLIDPHKDVADQATPAPTGSQVTLQQYSAATAGLAGVNNRVRRLYEQWQGPFITYHRVWTGEDYEPNNPNELDNDERAYDWPLDPWGNPYRFYSPLGIIGETAEDEISADYDVDSFGNGLLMTQVTAPDADYVFDRFAVVSYGPNGIEGNDDGDVTNITPGTDPPNDDIIYEFGKYVNPSRTYHWPF